MGFKVFNLSCTNHHMFEGWFPSAEALDEQAKRGLISCPYCGETQVKKELSAPYVKGSSSVPQTNSSSKESQLQNFQSSATLEQVRALLMKEFRNIINKAEDVGDRFTEEAIKIHHGETEERSIRGQATAEQREQLLDEGIDVFSIPDAFDPKKQH